MNIYSLSIPLQVSAEHSARLKSLQETFALVCNALAPVVQETRCWNRVALHHMMYKTLREKFPQLGSQMVCNAIYSVSRTSRLVFQSPQSPFNIQRLADKPLPLLQFLSSAPVYFDRHTLSLKAGTLSMYTLDGRMRFELNMREEDLNRFKTLKLQEVLLKSVLDQYTLSFSFAEDAHPAQVEEDMQGNAYLPEYIVIDQVNVVKHSGALAAPASVKTKTEQSPVVLNFKLETNARPTTAYESAPTAPGIQLQLISKQSTQRSNYTTAVPNRSASPSSIWPEASLYLMKHGDPRPAAQKANSERLASEANEASEETQTSTHLTHPLGARS